MLEQYNKYNSTHNVSVSDKFNKMLIINLINKNINTV